MELAGSWKRHEKTEGEDTGSRLPVLYGEHLPTWFSPREGSTPKVITVSAHWDVLGSKEHHLLQSMHVISFVLGLPPEKSM